MHRQAAEVNGEIGAALDELIEAGTCSPIVGARFPLEQAAEALKLIDERGALGQGRARGQVTASSSSVGASTATTG